MESKAPSFCRLCDTSLDSPSVWRQHAKSDSHVYNLRLKFAEPGTVITPPSSPPRRQGSARSSQHSASDDESDNGSIPEDDPEPDPAVAVQFDARRCLFCSAESASFQDSLQHMSRTHGFAVARRDRLAVDAETVAAHLDLVIRGHRECIQCGSRRRTVEGVRHHMVARGHCRFDVSSETRGFYDVPPSRDHAAAAGSPRLPSGRVLRSTAGRDGRPSAARTPRRRHAAPARPPGSASGRRMSPGAGGDAPDGDDDDGGVADAQAAAPADTRLARLGRGDRLGLAHLRDYQVRSLVAAGARAADEARREAKHAELKLSKAGNVTLTGRFRADTSKRFRGPWG